MSSCPVEHVYFIGGTWHGRTDTVGCGCYVIANMHEVYRREPGSKVFRLSYEAPSKPVEEVQSVNVISEA